MQHHGAPTRLLDWSNSPYIGTYFAVESCEHYEHCALWAIDEEWFAREALIRIGDLFGRPRDEMVAYSRTLLGTITELESSFEQIILPQKITGIIPLRPGRPSKRQSIQQGHFVCPGNLAKSFDENLEDYDSSETQDHFHKICIPSSIQSMVLRELSRMNVERETLFPGLDGFSQSLAVFLKRSSIEDFKEKLEATEAAGRDKSSSNDTPKG